MKIETIKRGNNSVAVVRSDSAVITDVDSAMDTLFSVRHATGCDSIAIEKAAFDESFFILSNCLAGEILQKCMNYGLRLAIFGDFSGYTSRPLKDFIRESNRGHSIFFVDDAGTAVDKLMQ